MSTVFKFIKFIYQKNSHENLRGWLDNLIILKKGKMFKFIKLN